MDKSKLILAVGAGIVGGMLGAAIRKRYDENRFDDRIEGINSQKRLMREFAQWMLANAHHWSFDDEEIQRLFLEKAQFMRIADEVNREKAEGRGNTP